MEQLIRGVHRFRQDIFLSKRELFERLAKSQSPQTLFITCSDSRVEPTLLTQTQPGDLFILRNAGNIIPPFGLGHSSEAATIEYAVDALGVKEIIVCGHSNCGGVRGILDPKSLVEMPAVAAWLKLGEATRRVMRENYADRTGDALQMTAVEENVLMQIENLETHPCVAAKLVSGAIHLHAWVYDIAAGAVSTYDPAEGQFEPLVEARPMTPPRGRIPPSSPTI